MQYVVTDYRGLGQIHFKRWQDALPLITIFQMFMYLLIISLVHLITVHIHNREKETKAAAAAAQEEEEEEIKLVQDNAVPKKRTYSADGALKMRLSSVDMKGMEDETMVSFQFRCYHHSILLYNWFSLSLAH